MGSSTSIGYGLLLTRDAILDALGEKADYPAIPAVTKAKKQFCPDSGKRLSDVIETITPALPAHQHIVIEIDGERYADVIRITDESYEIPEYPTWCDGRATTWDKHRRVTEALHRLHHESQTSDDQSQTSDDQEDQEDGFDPYCRTENLFMGFNLFDMVCDETWTTIPGNNATWLATPITQIAACDEDSGCDELLSEDEDDDEDDYSDLDESDGTITLTEILDQQDAFNALRSKLEKMGFKDLQFVFQPLFHE